MGRASLQALLLLCAGWLTAQAALLTPVAERLEQRAPLHETNAPGDLLGEHGAPYYFWPDLPSGSGTTYEARFILPSAATLIGTRLVSLGGESENGQSVMQVVVDGSTVAELLFDLDGSGEPEDHVYGEDAVGWPIALQAGQELLLRITPDDASRAPSLTTDGDCQSHAGQGSWLTVDGEFGRTPLDHDLCVKALLEPVTDEFGPSLYYSDDLRAPLAGGRLPLNVMTRDRTGVMSMVLHSSGLSSYSDSLAARDSTGSAWHFSLPLDRYGPGEHLFTLSAVDSLGNQSDSTLVCLVEDGPLAWQGESGRMDAFNAPLFPVIGGAAQAVRFGVEDFDPELGLAAILPSGGEIRCSGDGSFHMLLVPDLGGQPQTDVDGALVAVAEDSLAAPGSCPQWVSFDFGALPDSLVEIDAWWVIQQYRTLENVYTAVEIGDTLVGNASWRYDPLDGSWSSLGERQLQIRVFVDEENCDTPLPFYADFDSTFADLECWDNTRNLSGIGWQVGTVTPDPGGEIDYFSPLLEENGREAEGDSLYARGSRAVFLDSDALGEGNEQRDSLFTPWIETGGEAALRLSFWSYYGHFANEEAYLITRDRGPQGTGAWTLLRGGGSLGLNEELADGTDFVPVWQEVAVPVAARPERELIQFGFVYEATYAYGWAIDSVVVEELLAGTPVADRPERVRIERVAPNPFNPTTTIELDLLQDGPLRLEVYNLLGQRVALLVDEKWLAAGRRRVDFRPEGLASGLYIARIQSAGSTDTRRLLLLK